jgi:hypothetical protein
MSNIEHFLNYSKQIAINIYKVLMLLSKEYRRANQKFFHFYTYDSCRFSFYVEHAKGSTSTDLKQMDG